MCDPKRQVSRAVDQTLFSGIQDSFHEWSTHVFGNQLRIVRALRDYLFVKSPSVSVAIREGFANCKCAWILLNSTAFALLPSLNGITFARFGVSSPVIVLYDLMTRIASVF